MLAVIEQGLPHPLYHLAPGACAQALKGCAPHPAAAQVGATNTTLISPVRAAANLLSSGLSFWSDNAQR